MIPCTITASPSKLAAFFIVRAISSDNQYKPTMTNLQMCVQSTQEKVAAAVHNLLNPQTISDIHITLKKNTHHQTMTRDQAHRAIEETILIAYEGNSPQTPLEDLEQIRRYAQHLDPQKDKEAIEAINFVSANKERTSYIDLVNFWWLEAWDGTQILRKFPIPEKIRKTPCSKMIPRLVYLSTKTK